MIVIGREFVEKRGWLKQSQFDIAFSLGRVTPGTNIVAFVAAVGAILRGWPGAILSVFALVLPSATIAVSLMQGFESWKSNIWVMGALGATTAAVTGMMWSTVWLLTKPHAVKNWFRTLVLFGGAFGAAWMGVTPIPIVLTTVLAGFLWKDAE